MRLKVWLGGAVPLILGLLLALLFSQTTLPNPVLYLRASLSTVVFLVGLLTSILLPGVLWRQFSQRQRQQQQATAVRAAAAEDRRRFLQRLDHELKNPLMAMRAGLANASPLATMAMPNSGKLLLLSRRKRCG